MFNGFVFPSSKVEAASRICWHSGDRHFGSSAESVDAYSAGGVVHPATAAASRKAAPVDTRSIAMCRSGSICQAGRAAILTTWIRPAARPIVALPNNPQSRPTIAGSESSLQAGIACSAGVPASLPRFRPSGSASENDEAGALPASRQRWRLARPRRLCSMRPGKNRLDRW